MSRGYTRAEEMLKNYYGVGKDLTPLFTEYNFLKPVYGLKAK